MPIPARRDARGCGCAATPTTRRRRRSARRSTCSTTCRPTTTTAAAGSSSVPTASCTSPAATRAATGSPTTATAIRVAGPADRRAGGRARLEHLPGQDPAHGARRRDPRRQPDDWRRAQPHLQLRPAQPPGPGVRADGPALRAEHGPSTDDEVDLLQAGKNYGWPHVAGYNDDRSYVYANWSARRPTPCASLKFDSLNPPASVPPAKESSWPHADFVPPLTTLFTAPAGYDLGSRRQPTIAPGSIEVVRTSAAIPRLAAVPARHRHAHRRHLPRDAGRRRPVRGRAPARSYFERGRPLSRHGDRARRPSDLRGDRQLGIDARMPRGSAPRCSRIPARCSSSPTPPAPARTSPMPQSADRRRFMGTISLAGLAGLPVLTVPTSTGEMAPQEHGDTAQPSSGVTRALARYVVAARPADLPAAVRKEAQRTLLNWTRLRRGRFAPRDARRGPGRARAVLRVRRRRRCSAAANGLDMLHAALMNGISSHVFDFDDTHLKTVIHPAGPVVSALLALAEYRPVSGRRIPQRDGARRRGGVPDRQRGVSRPLRSRLAHHRHRRRVRRRGGVRQGCSALPNSR